ncbi:hypothetical protein IFR04_005393 [Cadophora malorum]|uniref:FAD/NAD(P)-binding domain-containing protein n=1 Tax=Cadophora malorum TaxID=108018 RepID=A0A8H7TM82_9HELO|nr:hypothetical protein IFR04_005393 [Cadophora malorum]
MGDASSFDVSGESTDLPYVVEETILGNPHQLKVVCIGAGASGLDLAYKLKKNMRGIDFQIYEKNAGLGGTWLENTYPGCACDIPAHIYEYEWAPNAHWSQFYASGPEILQYFRDTAKNFDLEKYVKYQHEVVKAVWDEQRGLWLLKIRDGSTGEVVEDQCHFLVNGGGFLNNWKWPSIQGIESFQGTLLHSAAWDQTSDLKGRRIAVIGNGSSGIQLVTALQPVAGHLTTFIRNTKERIGEFLDHPEKLLDYRKAMENDLNGGFKSALFDSPEQAAARQTLREMMRARLGDRHDLADRITPDFGVGCRRPTPGVGYLEALTEKNVRVVFNSITRIVSQGIELDTGEIIELDAIVCATGFDVSWKPRFPVIGRGAIDIREQWSDRPTAYLSLAVPNFPNYIIYMGPNGPLSHGSAIPSIEHITKYVIKLLHKAQTERYKAVVPTQQALDDFIEHADTFLARTVWNAKCRSWLKGGKQHPAVLSQSAKVY